MGANSTGCMPYGAPVVVPRSTCGSGRIVLISERNIQSQLMLLINQALARVYASLVCILNRVASNAKRVLK